MSSLLSCDVDPWPIVCPTVVVYFSFKFALIEFSFKKVSQFLSDCFMPAALSRFGKLFEFGTLAEFGKVAEYSFPSLPIVELASSINIPLTLTDDDT